MLTKMSAVPAMTSDTLLTFTIAKSSLRAPEVEMLEYSTCFDRERDTSYLDDNTYIALIKTFAANAKTSLSLINGGLWMLYTKAIGKSYVNHPFSSKRSVLQYLSKG